MKRMVRWMLFETWAGDCLLWLLETGLGVAVAPVESIAELTGAGDPRSAGVGA